MPHPGQSTYFSAQSYLRYQGAKFVRRFDSNCYIAMTRKLDTHDVSRGRAATVAEALALIQQPTLVLGIESDGLFTFAEQEELAAHIPHARLGRIDSPEGHDAFLLQFEQVNRYILEFLHEVLPDIMGKTGGGEETGDGGDGASGGDGGGGGGAGAASSSVGQLTKSSTFGEAEVEDITALRDLGTSVLVLGPLRKGEWRAGVAGGRAGRSGRQHGGGKSSIVGGPATLGRVEAHRRIRFKIFFFLGHSGEITSIESLRSWSRRYGEPWTRSAVVLLSFVATGSVQIVAYAALRSMQDAVPLSHGLFVPPKSPVSAPTIPSPSRLSTRLCDLVRVRRSPRPSFPSLHPPKPWNATRLLTAQRRRGAKSRNLVRGAGTHEASELPTERSAARQLLAWGGRTLHFGVAP
ncbi:hypothetical protein VTK73DRAFT_2807 [Phialemonium thermophilum]|uniref:AB hydrolase-1 domain-containing protein n=1 Tax=Phialemonium thermophilum TaxID=223376 RepID=A0ABR3VPL9_9PEZI